jgi:Flp pilus assembly pilin Flp
LASGNKRNLWKDESGAVFIEMTAAILTFFIILGGVVDSTYLYYQWNAATKAVQQGARVAAVSAPVASNLTTMTGLSNSVLPGDAMPPYNCTCNGATAQCTGTVPPSAPACTYSAAAMNTLVFGRGKTACAAPTSIRDVGMCNYFDWANPASRLQVSHVIVQYQYTGLGYAGRPGGPVPTVSVRLQNRMFNFVFLQSLLGFTPINLPGLATTVTGEDLSGS